MTIEERRGYKAKWAKEKYAKDFNFAEKQRALNTIKNRKRSEIAAAARQIKFNIVGHKFGLLTVTGRTKEWIINSYEKMWICKCDCGTSGLIKNRNELHNGDVRSCGCLKKTLNVTHGESKKREYKIWFGIKERCYNPKNSAFKNYGGRGITMCERWQVYDNFLYDMGRRPSPEHSIDRNDNDGIYSPENCRWATWSEQANNKRCVSKYMYNGLSHSISEWAKILNMKRNTLYGKLKIKKNTIEEVVGNQWLNFR